MVVVLPTPFTPTIRITKGLLAPVLRGTSTGRSRPTKVSLRCRCTALASVSSLRPTFFVRSPSISCVAETPTSEVKRMVSSSSSIASSKTFAPRKTLCIPSDNLLRVFPRPDLRRLKKPTSASFVSSATLVGIDCINPYKLYPMTQTDKDCPQGHVIS